MMISERTIKIIGEHLRAGREAQGRSLDDIAIATRINLQFLEQLENGSGPKLPITYIDAFVKDYAREIGLNLDELLEKIGESVKDPNPPPVSAESGYTKTEVPEVEYKAPQTQFPFALPHHIRLLIIVIAVVAIGLITTLFIIGDGEPSETPPEISFTDAVNEQEIKLRQTAAVTDTTAKIDTLVFEGTVRETVWVRVIMDGKDSSEAIFPPSAVRKWYAAESLLVSVGNAQAITFKLNGREVGTLSETRRPLRNVKISRATLSQLDKRKEGQ
jgi:cytoskeleton protein RodZ